MNAPTEMQLDALREVANIGCGHAANALSRLVGGRQVDIDVPRALMADGTQLPALLGGDEAVVAASLQLLGDLSGRLLLVLPADDADALATLLTNGPPAAANAQSALSEVANIVASACLSAIAELTGFKLLPSVPMVEQHPARVVASEVLSQLGEPPGPIVVLEARFSTSTAPAICGQLLVVPARSSLKRLLERLGV